MTENQTSSGSSVPGGAGAQASFPRRGPSIDGPETIVNPERRGLSGSGSGQVRHGGGSSLWTRLFPHDTPNDQGLPSGPDGCRLGHFHIEGAIGTGGMGAVFRARDERLDRIVALKVLSPSLSRDAASVQRFINEARAAARLDHDNIARVFYVGEDQGLHFIAHEFVTGRNIRDIIRDQGPLHPREAVNYALQIATALRHTSAFGVVHRDIKPSNIIVGPHGRAKLVDLGLAKKVASESFGEITIAGTTLGTFDYISPEQAKDPRNVDVRSDIYSLGCTLYHMLAGEPPYPEGTVLQKLLDHQAKDVPDPMRKNPRVTSRLSAVVRRMMAADPRDRYATPDDVIIDLLPIAAELGLRGINPEGLVWTSRPVTERTFVERNLTWIVAIAALLLFALLIDRYPQQVRNIRRLDVKSADASASREDAGNRVAQAGTKTGTQELAAKATIEGSTPRGETTDSSAAKGGRLDAIVLEDPESKFSDPLASDNPAAEAAGNRDVSMNRETRPEQAPGTQLPSNAVASTAGSKADAAPEIPPAHPQAAPEISTTEGGVSTAYATLEAAVADAKDGGIIELKFNGPRLGPEKPLHIAGKRVIIRCGKGFHPVILFSPRDPRASATENRMITLNNGDLELVDVDVTATVPDSASVDRWALFSLGGIDRLRLRGVDITVNNPGNRPAEVVDVASARDPLVDRMGNRQAGPMGATQEFEVEIEHAFIRGGCTLFAVRTTEAGRLDVKQSAAALQGAMLANWGDDDAPGESKRLSLRLEHVTCMLGGGLIQMDSGEVPRYLLPVSVTARNNIFSSNSTAPLISLAGRTNDEEFRRLLRWDGARNFYDKFTAYWSLATADSSGVNVPLQFDEWKRLMGETEVDANNGGIAWKQSWRSKPFGSIGNEDLELALPSQAISAATDSTDVGTDLSILHPITGGPHKDQPAPADRPTIGDRSAARPAQ